MQFCDVRLWFSSVWRRPPREVTSVRVPLIHRSSSIQASSTKHYTPATSVTRRLRLLPLVEGTIVSQDHEGASRATSFHFCSLFTFTWPNMMCHLHRAAQKARFWLTGSKKTKKFLHLNHQIGSEKVYFRIKSNKEKSLRVPLLLERYWLSPYLCLVGPGSISVAFITYVHLWKWYPRYTVALVYLRISTDLAN